MIFFCVEFPLTLIIYNLVLLLCCLYLKELKKDTLKRNNEKAVKFGKRNARRQINDPYQSNCYFKKKKRAILQF